MQILHVYIIEVSYDHMLLTLEDRLLINSHCLYNITIKIDHILKSVL